MTPDKLPVNSTWQLKEHDNVERPYWEITNGPISLCVNDEDIEEEHITAMKEIVSALNSGGIKFHSENALEVKQHIEIMKLRDEAQHMADTLEWIKTYGPCDDLTVKFIDKALQQFKDGKGVTKNEVCTCDNIQLATHGECWACPGRLTKDGKEVEPVKQEIPQPDLGLCKECKTRPATTDYNGHGHYVCKLCDDSLNREFDEEYR